MKLYNLVKLIKIICLNQPNVNSFFEGDVYEISHRQDVEFSTMVLTHQTHNINNGEGFEVFGMNLFYVDRLTSDNDNRLDVQSHAIQVLNSVVNQIEEQGLIIDNYQVNEFTERFNEECAGAFVSLQIRTDLNDCDFEFKVVTSDEFDALEKKVESLDAYTKQQIDDKLSTKADKSEIPSLDGYATEEWVNGQGYLKEHQPLKTINGESLIGSGDIEIKGGGEPYDDSELRGRIETLESNEGTFQTDIDTLNGEVDTLSTQMKTKAEKSELFSGDYNDLTNKPTIPSLDGYATEQWVEDKGYLTEHQSLENYYTKGESDSKYQPKGDYATKSDIPSLDGYATKDEVGAKQDTLISGTNIKTINGQTLLGEGNLEIGGGASGNYLPLTGGTLTGRIQIGNADNNSITNAFLHQRFANNTWNGACFAINGDGTASFQHKIYGDRFTSARNDAILRFSYNGLQFGKAASGNVAESDYKNVVLEPDLDPLKTRLTNIETQLNGLDEVLNNLNNSF